MQLTARFGVLVALLATTAFADDGVFVESVFPPSLQRGQVNRVTVRGSNMRGAVGLWTTLPETIATARQVAEDADGEATFEVEITDDAPLGFYGLRLATRDGLSNVHLFAIDELRSVAETEAIDEQATNNKRRQAQAIELPAAVIGTCKDTDVDHFAIEVAEGASVSFEVVGNRLGKAFDPVLTIYDNDGKFVVERDNDPGLFFDCRFQHKFDQAGRYIVRLHDTRFEGSPNWTYMLRMGRFPVARVALPSTAGPGEASLVEFPQGDCGPREVAFPTEFTTERFFFDLRGDEHNAPVWLSLAVSPLKNVVEAEPNETAEQPTVATVPCNLHGMMNRAGDEDFFQLDLRKGQRLEFRADTRDMGSAADLELTLIGPDGKNLKTVDDVHFEDATFEYSAQADGRYLLKIVEVVRDFGPEYVYRVEVREREPAIQLTSEIGRVAIPQGTWQPLPLQLTRKDFAGDVELELVGAPAGMTLREATIPNETKEFNGALVVDETTQAGIYTLQVVASAMKDDKPLRTVARTQPLVDRLPTGRGPHGEPFELREDQRRLPPSLTDRIAVVVLPPTPYDFEITTPLVTLPRYTEADFHIETTRADSFDAPVQFVARGGQLNQNRLRKPSIVPEIPDAKPGESTVVAKLRSGVNTTVTKYRVTVTATAKQGERTINLTRTFDLQVKLAFAPTLEPKKLELRPGDSAKVRLLPNRLAPFTGPLTFTPNINEGIQVPKEFVVEDAQESFEFEVSIASDIKPGAYKIKLPASTRINKFYESGEGEVLEVVVVEKKKEAGE
jgi:hypothetical protein